MMYEVKPVVCDYGIYGNDALILITNSHANALLICEILNEDDKGGILKVKVLRCKDCTYYKAQNLTGGEPSAYVCCRTNGYSPHREHYCAWAEQSLVPERYRYTAGCTSYYTEERNKVNE